MATATRSGQRISGNGSTSNGDALGLIETKGLVGIVQCVAVPVDLFVLRKRPRLGRVVRVVAGDGQVRDEERLFARFHVNPFQDPLDRGGLVDAEARFEVAANFAGIAKAYANA